MKAMKAKKLMCYYSHEDSSWLLLQPLKVEILHPEPLVMFHDILIDSESELIKEMSAKNVIGIILEVFFISFKV